MAIIVPIDDYSPIIQGDTASPFIIQVLHVNGFLSILGATITMTMQNVDNPSLIKTCGPNWSIDSLDNGRASYAYDPGDVDTPGSWMMWIKIVLNGRPLHPDDGTGSPKILTIKPLPSGV